MMTQNNDDNDGEKPANYEVGYKKPPKHTQFQPGHRGGNRKGRPKGSKNFDTAFDAANKMTRHLTMNGQRKKVTSEEVIAMQIVNKAATGDAKAVTIYLNEKNRREEKKARSETASKQSVGQTPASDAPITAEEAEAAYREALKNAKPTE